MQNPSSGGPMMGAATSSAAVMDARGDTMQQQEKTENEEQAMVDNNDGAMKKKGAYVAYKDGIIGNGEIAVLFFHAAWCPICKRVDGEIIDWYAAGGDGFLNVYKVDYDSSIDLRQRYGVTYQHTFVKIDGQGNVIEQVQGPTDAQLMVLLKSHIPCLSPSFSSFPAFSRFSCHASCR
jgi:thiol-disulfide isomerase/thioredoxin